MFIQDLQVKVPLSGAGRGGEGNWTDGVEECGAGSGPVEGPLGLVQDGSPQESLPSGWRLWAEPRAPRSVASCPRLCLRAVLTTRGNQAILLAP